MVLGSLSNCTDTTIQTDRSMNLRKRYTCTVMHCCASRIEQNFDIPLDVRAM